MKLAHKIMAVLLCATLVAMPLASCGALGKTESERFTKFTHEAFVDSVSNTQIDLHYTLANPAAYGIEKSTELLGRYDMSQVKAETKELKATYKQLQKFRYEALTPEQQLTYDVIKYQVERSLAHSGFEYYSEPTPSTGLQSSLPVLLTEYLFHRESDVDDYLALVADVDGLFESIITVQQERAKQGLFMADFTADTIIKGLDDFAASTDDNYMIVTFADRLNQLPELTDEQRADYTQRNREAVLTKLLPAYRKLADGLRALKGTGKNEGGLANLPRGKEYYELLAQNATGSERNVKELQTWLNQQIKDAFLGVARIATDYPDAVAEYGMDGLYEISVEETDPAVILKRLEIAINRDFTPLSGVTYQLNEVHPAMQESMSPAFYLTPPIDVPGRNPIYINPFHIQKSSNIYLFTTLAHEGFPGHLYQNNFYAQHPHDPVRNVMSFNGYSEGWGTYAEMLAFEYAMPDEPAAGLLQRYNQELTLALYCLIDIGVHHDGWTREETAEFLSTFGFPAEGSNIMFEAVIADPANYLSYGVGYFEFKALRQRAEAELGDAFSAVEFHNTLLSTGSAPFAVVGKQVDGYINATKNGTASVAASSQAAA